MTNRPVVKPIVVIFIGLVCESYGALHVVRMQLSYRGSVLLSLPFTSSYCFRATKEASLQKR
jgi:hypothetical protein